MVVMLSVVQVSKYGAYTCAGIGVPMAYAGEALSIAPPVPRTRAASRER